MLGCKWLLYIFLLQNPAKVKWAMGKFSLLDTLSKSLEREPQ